MTIIAPILRVPRTVSKNLLDREGPSPTASSEAGPGPEGARVANEPRTFPINTDGSKSSGGSGSGFGFFCGSRLGFGSFN
jgi:hypothetical protein